MLAEQEEDTVYEQVSKKAGKDAAAVWSFLQSEESRANAGPKGALLRQVDQIAQATGLGRERVQDAVIKLAVNRLITKVTADGRVAA